MCQYVDFGVPNELSLGDLFYLFFKHFNSDAFNSNSQRVSIRSGSFQRELVVRLFLLGTARTGCGQVVCPVHRRVNFFGAFSNVPNL